MPCPTGRSECQGLRRKKESTEALILKSCCPIHLSPSVPHHAAGRTGTAQIRSFAPSDGALVEVEMLDRTVRQSHIRGLRTVGVVDHTVLAGIGEHRDLALRLVELYAVYLSSLWEAQNRARSSRRAFAAE